MTSHTASSAQNRSSGSSQVGERAKRTSFSRRGPNKPSSFLLSNLAFNHILFRRRQQLLSLATGAGEYVISSIFLKADSLTIAERAAAVLAARVLPLCSVWVFFFFPPFHIFPLSYFHPKKIQILFLQPPPPPFFFYFPRRKAPHSLSAQQLNILSGS